MSVARRGLLDRSALAFGHENNRAVPLVSGRASAHLLDRTQEIIAMVVRVVFRSSNPSLSLPWHFTAWPPLTEDEIRTTVAYEIAKSAAHPIEFDIEVIRGE